MTFIFKILDKEKKMSNLKITFCDVINCNKKNQEEICIKYEPK